MKTLTNILILTVVGSLLACSHNAKDNSLPNGIARKALTEEDIDSLRLEYALNDAFRIAATQFHREKFNTEYAMQPDDSSFTIHIEIIVGYLFSDEQKYFLLRRHTPGVVYLDLYKVINTETEKVISRAQGPMSYVRDMIGDVNGDGFKDFLVHWYPSSGCCQRDVYNVYLNLPDKRTFTGDYEFINPTFFASEGIIRGVDYGHPGEVGLYKYRWNGLQIDTLEFIYPDANHKGQFIKTKKPRYHPTQKAGIVLKSVPAEYHSIESYEWFADF